jgi:hypothetical protein
MTTPALQGGTPGSLLDDHIGPFLKHLRAAGYAERTLRKKRTVTKAFARWARRKQIAGSDLNDGHIAAFVSRSPRNRKAHVKFELAVMRLLFEYLRGYGGLQRPPMQDCGSAADTLLQDYKIIYGKTAGSLRIRCLSMRPSFGISSTPRLSKPARYPRICSIR